MSKNRLILTALAIFIVVGSIQFVLGGTNTQSTLRDPASTNTVSASSADFTNFAVTNSPDATTRYVGVVTGLESNKDAKYNIFTLHDRSGVNLNLHIPTNIGVQGQDMWMILNTAFISGKTVGIWVDSDGFVYEVYLTSN
jgi:hypothetical protein